jgi:uncharacterized protein
MYKFSYYNFLIADPDGKFYLLYNALYNGLYEINEPQYKILEQFEKKQTLYDDELNCQEEPFISMLLNNKIIIDTNVDEREIIKKRAGKIKDEFYRKKSFLLVLVPSNNCNLDCIYCFEGEKRHKGIAQRAVFDELLKCIENEICSEKCDTSLLNVIWYGGEPMFGLKIINEYAPLLLDMAKRHNLKYSASIITNGTLLNRERWGILLENKIDTVQITIDGDEMTHNALRPHVNKDKNSYHMILDALQSVPENMKVTIRVNCNRVVATSLPNLLKDLDKYGIWPHKAKQIRIKLAKMINYPNSRISSEEELSEEEYFSICEDFRYHSFLYAYNWTTERGLSQPKFAFQYLNLSSFSCGTTHCPYVFVMDQYGFLYKCWNYVNDTKHRLQHISKPYKEIFQNPNCTKLLDFSKLNDPECFSCKHLPVCDKFCTIDWMENRKRCCGWKSNLKEHFIRQYRRYLTNPASFILK